MKHIILPILFLASSLAFSQDACSAYFPIKTGTQIERKEYNGKEKLTGSQITIVKAVEKTSSGMKITLSNQSLDKKGEIVATTEFTATCTNDVLQFNIADLFISNLPVELTEGMEMDISGDEIKMPSNLKAGQELEGGTITIKTSINGTTLSTMTFTIRDRKVEAIEEVKVEAGTYSCAKIVYQIDAVMPLMKRTMKGEQWMNEKVGEVQSKSYNQKGKLMSRTEIASVKGL